MRALSYSCFTLLITAIVFLSALALLINYFIYSYSGNNYFPDQVYLIFLILVFFYLGLVVYFGRKHRFTHIGKELIYFFAVMSVIALATNAVQLTPFPPIDHYLLEIESALDINMQSILSWMEQHSHLKTVLTFIYDSLAYQMAFIPLVAIASERYSLIRNYYFLMLSTTLLGFSFYYFFPSLAPASIIQSPLFSEAQRATGLKFHQIHDHLIPSTLEGGLIAFPSFHTIWALLCVYLLKDWRIPCFILLGINCLLLASCVLLGWHYLIDVVGGVLLLALCFYLMRICHRHSTHFI